MWRITRRHLSPSKRTHLISFLTSPPPITSTTSIIHSSSSSIPISQPYSSTIPRISSSSAQSNADYSAKLGFGIERTGREGLGLGVERVGGVFVGPVWGYGKCYWELSKAKLSMLVVATSGTGHVLGSGHTIDLPGLCWTCAGTMMVAAAANSLNQVFEVKNDAKMKRTQNRPLPSGRISVSHALMWASTVGIVGTSLLASKANMLAAGLAASNLFLYAFLYTPLKQIHPINTWVGAVVGAIPPLLGWAAASGEISLNGLILPAALYFWQIPHFMALAYLCRNDYAAGGFKMLSLGDASGRRTALVALRNCLYLVPLGYLAYEWGVTSGWFCLESSLLTLAITATALSFYFDRSTKNARRMFHASLLYLPVFMGGLVFHRLSDDCDHHMDNGLTTTVHNPNYIERNDNVESSRMQNKSISRTQRRPPVAYASAAPFPFLPAPSY